MARVRVPGSAPRDHNQTRPPLGPADARECARARAAFLAHEPVSTEVVRQPILASWARSRQWNVPTADLTLPVLSDLDRDSALIRAAAPVLDEVDDQLVNEPVSVILCDADGFVLDRRSGDSGLTQHLDRVQLAPGVSYAERFVGTNGIGTALESHAPALVFGHEHYVDHLDQLACAGAPIRHPVTGKQVGVIDLTCWRRDASRTLGVTASTLAHRIEEALLHQSGERELAVLHDYLTACRRNRGLVVALGDDLLMMNDQARGALSSADQTALLAQASELLRAGRSRRVLVDLPSGRLARVRCQPSVSKGTVAGGVLLVQLHDHAAAAAERAGGWPTALPALSIAVGSSRGWITCCRAVDSGFRNREWLVIQGEAGTGKTTLARATHQGRAPRAHLRVFDAERYGPGWLPEVSEELRVEGASLILAHLDRLPAEGIRGLRDALEPYRESTDLGRPWVVATITGADTAGARGEPTLSDLLSCFPRTVDVPPLRHRPDDLTDLVPHLLARLSRGGDLTCSAETMRILMRNRWPGNVAQLRDVLRKIVARVRAGVLRPHDLPPECYTGSRRQLTALESLECDAIVAALLETNGNKAEAAHLLGMSRATIFRKVRAYGISVPASAGPSGRARGGQAQSSSSSSSRTRATRC